jgi:cytochrome b6-f complex iron-sulfur subunit
MSKGLKRLLPRKFGSNKAALPQAAGSGHVASTGDPASYYAPAASADSTRRSFIGKVGMVAAGLSLGLPAALSVRSLVPNMLYEAPQRVKLGTLDNFTDGSTFLPLQRLFIFRDKSTFHCISARCTHLGCTVQLAKLEESGEAGKDYEFRCPCHGSKFHYDGVNYAGPAPEPLYYHPLEVAVDDGQLVVDMGARVDRGWRFTV